jgi:hypothetical protein
MGIAIEVDGFPTKHPFPLKITFECDARVEMFCHKTLIVADACSYVEAHHMAIGIRWLERNASNGRVWLCPECSGK